MAATLTGSAGGWSSNARRVPTTIDACACNCVCAMRSAAPVSGWSPIFRCVTQRRTTAGVSAVTLPGTDRSHGEAVAVEASDDMTIGQARATLQRKAREAGGDAAGDLQLVRSYCRPRHICRRRYSPQGCRPCADRRRPYPCLPSARHRRDRLPRRAALKDFHREGLGTQRIALRRLQHQSPSASTFDLVHFVL